MRTPRLALAAAAVLIALTGCGQAAGSPAGSPAGGAASAPADPVERVNAAADTMNRSSFKFTIEADGVRVEGARHKPSESMRFTMKSTVEGNDFSVELIQIGRDMWLKTDLGLDATDDPQTREFANALSGWTHVTDDGADSDISGLAKAGAMAMGADMVKGASELKETAPGTFTGTIDLTSDIERGFADADTIKAMGASARTVPITVTLDSEERFSSLAYDMPAAGETKAQRATVTFFDFDKVEQPAPPPADQVREG